MMATHKISRNDPCPCGSGKKFKHCCLAKGIDWEARQAAQTKRPFPTAASRPKAAPLPSIAGLGPFRVVDAKLKEIATGTPADADWKTLVEGLSETTPDEERIETYRTVRHAGVLPEDTAFFLFGHAMEWMPSEEDDLDRHTLATLRRHRLDDLADLFVNNRLEYDRRYERGRQFFFGPPDELHAKSLREKGVIE